MSRFTLYALWLCISAVMFCVSIANHWTLAWVIWGINLILDAVLLILEGEPS